MLGVKADPARPARCRRGQGQPRADQPRAAPVLRGVHQGLGQVPRRRALVQAGRASSRAWRWRALLSGVDSPLATFLRGVARETTLVPPPQAGSAAPSSSARWRRSSRSVQAKREAAALAGKLHAPAGADAARRWRRWSTTTSPPSTACSTGTAAADRRDAEAVRARSTRSSPRSTRRRRASRAPPPAGGAERVQGRRRPAARADPQRCWSSWPTPRATQSRSAERDGLTSRAQADHRLLQPHHHRPLPVRRRARRPTCCPTTSAQLFGAGGMLDDFFQRQAGRRWSTPARNPGPTSRLADGTQAGRRRRRWPTSSAPRASARCSSAAAARRRRSRSTCARSRWTTA